MIKSLIMKRRSTRQELKNQSRTKAHIRFRADNPFGLLDHQLNEDWIDVDEVHPNFSHSQPESGHATRNGRPGTIGNISSIDVTLPDDRLAPALADSCNSMSPLGEAVIEIVSGDKGIRLTMTKPRISTCQPRSRFTTITMKFERVTLSWI